jgi:hypothetical protein
VLDDFGLESEDDDAEADDEDFASDEDVVVDGFDAGELLDEEPRLSLR